MWPWREEVEDDPGSVAFIRWYLLKTPWLTICLHRFLKSDHWDPHNHEYDSISVILKGFYIETIATRDDPMHYQHARHRWSVIWRPAEIFHSISLPWGWAGDVWTLFIMLKPRLPPEEVGYLVLGRFIPLEKYDAMKGHRKWPHGTSRQPAS